MILNKTHQIMHILNDTNSFVLHSNLHHERDRLNHLYYLTYQKGITKPVVNGNMIKGSVKLKNADIIKIGATELKFNS